MSGKGDRWRVGAAGWVWLCLVALGAVVSAWEWVVDNPGTVRSVQTVVWWVAMAVLVIMVGWWWVKRRSEAGGGVSGGWGVGDRVVFSVARPGGGARAPAGPGVGGRQRRVSPELEFWLRLLRLAGGLVSRSGWVVRALWAVVGGRLVFGVSVDQRLGAGAKRSAKSAWGDMIVGEWPVPDGQASVSERAPMDIGVGKAVVRRYLVPEVLWLPLRSVSVRPDHPMGSVLDITAGHPGVDVQLRVDLVALSPAARDRACEERLEQLGDDDLERGLWETDEGRGVVAGVRVLLRVSREGVGHMEECTGVADRIVGVLDSLWSTDHNRLVVREVEEGLFDRIWDSGVVEDDVPVWHWDRLVALLGPPPPGIGKQAEEGGRLPDPPLLETFDPRFL